MHTHTCMHMYIAAVDYLGTIRILTFTSEGSQTVSVPILDDTVVEDTESFQALLSSSDDFVLFGRSSTDVLIQDNDGNY